MLSSKNNKTINESKVSIDALQASELRFHNLIDQATNPICVFKGENMVLDLANEPMLKTWNVGIEAIGKPFLKILPEIDDQSVMNLLVNVYNTGETYVGIELPITMARDENLSPQLRYFNFSYQPIYDENKIICSILVIGYEVTDQVLAKNKNLETEHAKAKELEEKVQLRTLELQEANEELQRKNQEITLSKYNKRFLTDFSERFASFKTQNEFFDSLVQFIADSTKLDYVFIGNLEQNKEGTFDIQTISITSFGKLTANIHYPLADGPCEQVVRGTIYAYPENCRQIFPKSQTLKTFNVEGSIGFPLYDTKENAIGLITVLHQKKIEDIETVSSILKIVAKRAEIEFERIKNEELLEEKNIILEEKNRKLELINIELEQKNKEVESAREKLLSEYSRSLIEASRDPLITISSKGKITDMNEAFANITGFTRKQLTGTDFFDYFTDPQKAQAVYQEVFNKGFVSDYPLTIKDHKFTDVLFNGSTYKDEQRKVLGAVVVARDITEQRKIETELIEAKVFAELATAIAEEAQGKAESAALIAEVAVRSKQQFLSNMSHEIRTPMNAIIGFTKVLLKTPLTVKQKEYLSAVKLSGDALIVLINDILDLAKVDAGKMTFEHIPFKLSASISSMLHLFETKIQEKNLALDIAYDTKIPEVIIGDPVRLHQIILNLVSNAVKFTTKGKIMVSVILLKEDEEKVTIEFAVKDTGIGISESKIENIFENFQQATSETSRIYGGTGLGLAIVKQLLEPQGGSIRVESKENEGSTFSFTLDFQKTNAEAILETEIMELDSEIKDIKVLVVEDMALNQLLMRTLLDDFGFACDITANGKLAIEKLENNTYDIVLMDLQMPEMNGFEATEYIRNTMNSKIPIIALTADVTTVDLAKCKDVGMNDYIAKPIDERLLYSKIVGLVKKPAFIIPVEKNVKEEPMPKKLRCTDLNYLIRRTKSNPVLMMEMISLYLEQTPPLINTMKQSLLDKDWKLLYGAVHKMIPSFAIMGINADFETIAKKIQEFANMNQQSDVIIDLVSQLDNVCTQACEELKEELNKIKNTK